MISPVHSLCLWELMVNTLHQIPVLCIFLINIYLQIHLDTADLDAETSSSSIAASENSSEIITAISADQATTFLADIKIGTNMITFNVTDSSGNTCKYMFMIFPLSMQIRLGYCMSNNTMHKFSGHVVGSIALKAQQMLGIVR